jgi:hypothetical protein
MSDQSDTEPLPKSDDLLRYAPWLAGVFAIILLLAYWGAFSAQPWTENPASWGAFGDYIGGILNPTIALFTLIVAVGVWKLQKLQLIATQKELVDTRKAIKDQTFDQFFMGMLAAHRSMVEQVTLVNENGVTSQNGKRAVDSYLLELKIYDEKLTEKKEGISSKYHTVAPDPDLVGKISKCLQTDYPVFKLPPESALAFFAAFCVRYYQKVLDISGYQIHHHEKFLSYEQIFGHIFRSTYQILKLVDEKFSDNPALAKRYVNLLRAQMSESEFIFFSLSAITKDGEKSWARSVRLNFFEGRLNNLKWTKDLVALFEQNDESLREASEILEKEN